MAMCVMDLLLEESTSLSFALRVCCCSLVSVISHLSRCCPTVEEKNYDIIKQHWLTLLFTKDPLHSTLEGAEVVAQNKWHVIPSEQIKSSVECGFCVVSLCSWNLVVPAGQVHGRTSGHLSVNWRKSISVCGRGNSSFMVLLLRWI